MHIFVLILTSEFSLPPTPKMLYSFLKILLTPCSILLVEGSSMIHQKEHWLWGFSETGLSSSSDNSAV